MRQMKDIYKWEIELSDGTIITEGINYKPGYVVRISFVSSISILPRHDIFFTDFKFEKRFTRSFMGWNSIVKEQLHCVITDKFRFYLFSSSGRTIITERDYELYL